MNPDLDRLQPYPFQKLAGLLGGITPLRGKAHIRLSIGEPQDAPPAWLRDTLCAHLDGLRSYPLTKGELHLRQAIAEWLTRRFTLPPGAIDAERHVLPVTGTREALFSVAQALVDRTRSRPLVAMPNPFYQIYEGAALLAGAEPYFINCIKETSYLPDFSSVPEEVWQRCQILYLCSPGNPSGAVLDEAQLGRLIELADRYDFIIASDECYSEIYFDPDAPPPGILGAASRLGNTGFRRCIAFHSLSKRSNVPGMRSGFVAGDVRLLERFQLYRTYHGCAMSPTFQAASTALWNDETHVVESRARYQERFAGVHAILDDVLPLTVPPASFYLWPQLPVDGETFARRLFAEQHVTVLPGSYLSREAHGINPGQAHVRIALVAPLDDCLDAARRMRETLLKL